MALLFHAVEVFPQLQGDAQEKFVRAALKRCGEILRESGFDTEFTQKVTIPELDLPVGVPLSYAQQAPERFGAQAGAGLAARIVSLLQGESDPATSTAPKAPRLAACSACGRDKTPITATNCCMYCGAPLDLPTSGSDSIGLNRRAVFDAAFKLRGWVNETGMAGREIDRQYAQRTLEKLGATKTMGILDLGTPVRAPFSDLDYAVAVIGEPDVAFTQIHQSLQGQGIEANPGGLQNALLDLDKVLDDARQGRLSSNLITKFMKADLLAGPPAMKQKLREIAVAIAQNAKLRDHWIQQVREAPTTGPSFGTSYNLKSDAGGIRVLQYLSYLGAFLSGKPHGAYERYDGLIEAGYITAEEGKQMQQALSFFRELRRSQHLASGKELDTYAPLPARGAVERLGVKDVADLEKRGLALVESVRVILSKVQSGLETGPSHAPQQQTRKQSTSQQQPGTGPGTPRQA